MEFILAVVGGFIIGVAAGYYAHYRWGTALKADIEKVKTAVRDIKK